MKHATTFFAHVPCSAALAWLLLLAATPTLLLGQLADEQTASAIVGTARLYFTPSRLQEMQQRVGRDVAQQQAWEDVLGKAEKLLQEDLVSLDYAESGSGQHGNYGRPSSQMASLASTLGLAYQMTGNVAYAEKLRHSMLHFGQLRRWAGDAGHDPPWHSELNTARFCFAYAVAYDSVRSYLSAEDRERIVAALVNKGILPTLHDWLDGRHRIHALDSMGHNWWSVCVAMAGVASLAIVEDDARAAEWVRQISEAFPEWFLYQGNILQNKSPNFDAKGAFYESVSYANYALSEYLLFRLAHANVFPDRPQPDIPLLKTAGDFFVHTAYPTRDGLLAVNFGDSSIEPSGARTLGLLLANGFEHAAYRWYLGRVETGWNDPVALVYPGDAASRAMPNDVPLSEIYEDIGWALMRNSWEDDATLLAVKSGFTWNHAHPDAGSFLLFHGGKPLIIDSGRCSYSRPQYTSYYRTSRAHNVILTDGEAQNPEDCARGDRGVVHPGRVRYLMDASGMKYVMADATGPTSWKFSRNYRHFLWIDDVILIVDDVRTHEPGQLEWLLHYAGEAEEEGAHVRLSNSAASTAVVWPLYPRDMTLTRKTGLQDNDPDRETEYLSWSPAEKCREMKFITAVLPLQDTQQDPRVTVELLEEEEMLGVRISAEHEITDVFLNLRADGRRMHRNSNHAFLGWETDAYLFAVTYPSEAAAGPEAIKRLLVASGSYLRRDGQVVLDSLSKVYALAGSTTDSLDVQLAGQPLIRCDLRVGNRPQQVRLNAAPVPIAWDEAAGVVRLRVE